MLSSAEKSLWLKAIVMITSLIDVQYDLVVWEIKYIIGVDSVYQGKASACYTCPETASMGGEGAPSTAGVWS